MDDPWDHIPLWALLAVPALFLVAALLIGIALANL
jgi:hypothetical protein